MTATQTQATTMEKPTRARTGKAADAKSGPLDPAREIHHAEPAESGGADFAKNYA